MYFIIKNYKMSENKNIKEIKPFRQMPFVDSNAELTLTGSEFVAIQNIINIFKESVNAVQNVFDRNVNNGNISIKYVQQDGTEISKEEAEEYLKQASKFLENKENPQS